jgi:hypothetical protein
MRQKISMICPTRGRPKMLERFVNSLYERGSNNLSNTGVFELLLIVDDDDDETIEFYNNNLFKNKTIKLITRERSKFFNRDYLTFGASRSSGDLIWGIADDVEIIADDWDKVLLDKVNKFEQLIERGTLANYFYNWKPGKKAYYINIDCNDNDFQNFSICRCSFPIITREAFEKLKFFAPHEWKFWGADYGLGEIYRRAGFVLSLSEIKVAHWSWANNNSQYTRNKDDTNKNSEKISSECDMVGAVYKKEEDVINKYVNILRDNNYTRKYSPSRISFEILASPLQSLIHEINSIDEDFNKQLKLSMEVPMSCPKCELEDISVPDFPAPLCPKHLDRIDMSTHFARVNSDEYSKEYNLLISCNVEGCDTVFDITNETLNCPNPVCDYVGPFKYELYKTLDSKQKAQNLFDRKKSLIQKYNDMVKLLQENVPQ